MKRCIRRDRRSLASLLFALMGLMALLSAGCRRSPSSIDGLSIREEVIPQPVHTGEVTVTVQLADASQNPVKEASIMVEADMAHPGMSPVFAAAKETVPGTYQSKMNLSMGGDWVVLLHIRLNNGTKIERQMDVRGVRSN
jgi:hypothetical protein